MKLKLIHHIILNCNTYDMISFIENFKDFRIVIDTDDKFIDFVNLIFPFKDSLIQKIKNEI